MREGRSVQARPGYFAVMDEPAAAAPERRLDREVLAGTVMSDVPASLDPLPGWAGWRQDRDLTALLHFDLRQMPRLKDFGSGPKRLTFIAALVDEQGGFVAGREGAVDLALKENHPGPAGQRRAQRENPDGGAARDLPSALRHRRRQ